MAGRWARLLTSLAVCIADVVARRPVVGIVASPLKLPGATTFNGLSWIWNTYVESLYDAGAEVVPLVPHSGTEKLKEALEQVDAVLWTGGEDDPGVHGATYPDVMMDTLKVIYEHIKAKATVPLWATCQGFQALCVLAANDPKVVVPTYGTLGTAVSLHFTTSANSSRLLRDAPPEVFLELGRRNSTLNFHSYGVLAQSFHQAKVPNFQLLATDTDTRGQVFASLMEHNELPMFASQFHPELYYFLDPDSAAQNPAVRHAVEANRYFMHFFVKEAAKNAAAVHADSATPLRIGEYPMSFPPLGIFGSSGGELFPGKILRGHVWNYSRPMTAEELSLLAASLRRSRGSGLLGPLGPIEGPWVARAAVVTAALLTAGMLSAWLRRSKVEGEGCASARSPPLADGPVLPA